MLAGAAPAGASMQEVAAGATGVIDLIQTVRDPSNGYISGSKHAALGRDLQVLANAANALVQDQGIDPGQTGKTIANFSSALDNAMARLDNIAGRDTEDASSIQLSLTLKAKLAEVRNSLPQQ